MAEPVRDKHRGGIGPRGEAPSIAAHLLTGRGDGLEIGLKKGGVARIRFDCDPAPGTGELRWLLTPKVLQTLARSA